MIPLYDVQCGCLGLEPGRTVPFTGHDLVAEMDRVRIQRGLMRLTPDSAYLDIVYANERVYAGCRASGGRLTPCPLVKATGGAQGPDETEQVEEALKQGAGAVWIRPATDGWLLADWVSDALFGVLQERRVPVLCLERLIPVEAVARVAQRFSQLPLIVAETHYRHQQTLLPLMRRFDNVHLSVGSNYCVRGGIEQLVAAVGPERLLFGTGLPEVEAAAAICQLMYAEIDEQAKRWIGAGNLDRLTGGIRR